MGDCAASENAILFGAARSALPQDDFRRRSAHDELAAHSITSSARASSVGGTVRPSAFAVFRLMTISILVENSIGKSPGLAPFRILSTNAAAWRDPSAWLTP